MSESEQGKLDVSGNRQARLDSVLKGPDKGRARQPWWQVSDTASQGAAPLSFAQERFWFLDRLQTGNPVYHVPSMIPLHGPIDVTALRESLAELVSRHAMLRTSFELRGDRPVQIVAAMQNVPMPVLACEGGSQDERRAEAMQLAHLEVVKPFDLRTGPLFRACLLKIDDAEHWFLLTMHHIVCDAWSMNVFFRELGQLYDALRSGRPAKLPELPLQYVDYARWQRHWLDGEVLAKLGAYWKEKLQGIPSVLELPLDHPRPAMVSFRGGLYPFVIPAAASSKMRELGRGEQATSFMTMLAAFKVLLHKYTRQHDIVVGTPAASRDRPELEGIVGLFLNTLVLRDKISRGATFRALLHQVRANTLEAYEHQDLPFEKIVEELQPDRNLNISPLFQVLFVLQTGQGGAASAGGANGPLGTGTAKFDLSLYLTDAGQEISGIWEYNSDLFDEATIARMAGHFQTLVEAIAANPDARIADLPLLTDVEQRQLAAWNATGAEYQAERCAHQLFEAQARATPDALALVFEGEQLSYRQLEVRANRLAHRLQALGVGPEVAVGICVQRSIDMVVALLAVLKAGGAYLPLDPAYPKERLAYMLDNGRAKVLLTQERLVTVLPDDYAGALVRVDADDALAGTSDEPPRSAVRPDNLAYIIYTSGSTGTAKGVGMSHRTLTNLTVWQNRLSPLGPRERTLQYNSFSFDVSFLEVISTLSAEGTLVLVSEAVRRDASAIAELLANERIKRLFMPYTALAQLAEYCAGRDALGLHLRQVVSTGEALQITAKIVELFRGLPGCNLHNEYGPTETHFVSEYMLRNEDAASWPMLPAVGRPIPNAEIYVLDEELSPVPIGVVGELYAGGLAVARCYVGNPAMTAERFMPNPLSEQPGARLYKTGDLARYRPDGNVELLGRRDHQVKVRGFRIELGEIEIVLAQHPDVQEAVVTARGTGVHDRHLVAYVVAVPERTPDAASMRRFLLEKLPEHMVPSVFVPMDRLPTGATGKVDRYRLPDPASRPALQRGSDFVAPRTEIEEELARIWAQILQLERVGVNDNFFTLGGHSLMVVQLATRIRDSFAVEIPIQRIFEALTLAELAQSIAQLQIEQADQEDLARLLDEIESGDEGAESEIGCTERPGLWQGGPCQDSTEDHERQ
jgi:amino acid adenylation domain-containing protein